jgi:photosystem I P700 chlorophyll a apoprotein A2
VVEASHGCGSVQSIGQLYSVHWGHLAVIAIWLSGVFYHVAWSGNLEVWSENPLQLAPVPHGLWDPHFCLSLRDAFSGTGARFG